jgi:indole-3-glycerol phosphate synthase
LEDILSEKRREIERLRSVEPASYDTGRPQKRPTLSLLEALRNSSPTAIIAEIKRKSPSQGVLRETVDPVSLARSYEEAGAVAISVLTDGPFFHGSVNDLEKVKDAVNVPVLRKDFILDESQIYESKAAGADALLLIAAALEGEELERLFGKTVELGMTPLVEVHHEEELGRVLALDPPLIGINNRDLATMRVDLETCLRLSRLIPPHFKVVAESGVNTPDDIRRLKAGGVDAFLIGTALMKSPDPAAVLKTLCLA